MSESNDLLKAIYELRERAAVAEAKAACLEAENKRLVQLLEADRSVARAPVFVPAPTYVPPSVPDPVDPFNPYKITCSTGVEKGDPR